MNISLVCSDRDMGEFMMRRGGVQQSADPGPQTSNFS